MLKLNAKQVAESAEYHGWGKGEKLRAHQTAVFVMCGGGVLGAFAANQPADFYIDDRVGRLPYPKKHIEQAVATLAIVAEQAGLDPHQLPERPRFHNCGIF